MPQFHERIAAITPERFAGGMTFEGYLDYVASAENLAREGYEGGTRADQSTELRAWYDSISLTEPQAAAMHLLAQHADGPARVLVLAEEWSSDCRRDVPVLARLAEAAGLELRIFTRDGAAYSGTPEPTDSPNADLMSPFVNRKPGGPYQSIPVAAFFDAGDRYLYHYTEYPALYRKDEIQAQLRQPRAGESTEAAAQRYAREWLELRQSPFFRMWASAAADEIITMLHQRVVLGG